MKDLYNENYKILLKEIKENVDKWKQTPSSWPGRLSIKMSVQHKAIYRVSIIHVKIKFKNYHMIHNATSEFIPKELKAGSVRDVCTFPFKAALFTVAKK